MVSSRKSAVAVAFLSSRTPVNQSIFCLDNGESSGVGDVMGHQSVLQGGLFVVRLRKRILSQEVVIGRIIENDQ